MKRYISWEEVETLVKILHDNILESEEDFDTIFGLPRGGLIPAVMLSHKTGISYFDAFRFSIPGNGHVLVVDDICDSGKTLQHLEYKTAVAHSTPPT